MTDQPDATEYLEAIHTTLLGIGVTLKQLLDRTAGRDTGPIPVYQAQPPVITPAPAPAPAPFAPLNTWKCPDHGTSKVVPAGISRKTGMAYDAFVACSEAFCKQKPPRPAAPQRAIPPSQQMP